MEPDVVELLDEPLDDELELDEYLGRFECVEGWLLGPSGRHQKEGRWWDCGGDEIFFPVLQSFKADLIVAIKALCWDLVTGGSVVTERHPS